MTASLERIALVRAQIADIESAYPEPRPAHIEAVLKRLSEEVAVPVEVVDWQAVAEANLQHAQELEKVVNTQAVRMAELITELDKLRAPGAA